MRIFTLTISLLLLWPWLAVAQETQEIQVNPSAAAEKKIYTWTDDKGVVHYEDERPNDAAGEVEQLDTGQNKGISTIEGTGLRESEKEFLQDAQKLSEIEARKQANPGDDETIVIISEDGADSADDTLVVTE